MNNFESLSALREAADRGKNVLSNRAELRGLPDDAEALHILWLYPDVLNLHGGRGDMMALLHVADLMELPVEIMRIDELDEEIPYEWAHMICLNSGEIKCAPEVAAAMSRQREELDGFIERGGVLWAAASSGAVLAREYTRLDGSKAEGLGLLDMSWQERESVWGDDIWFTADDGIQVMGCQIQVADVFLNEGQAPLGEIIYGRGNCGDGREGARSGNVIFTNCLGPMMVKNPRLAEKWLKTAAASAGIECRRQITDSDVEIEDKSFELIKKFINEKQNK